jgi:hypothetical protein
MWTNLYGGLYGAEKHQKYYKAVVQVKEANKKKKKDKG